MQLCLGTVQFGLDYGITGQKKPPQEYVVECLDYATQNGILAIDTAAAYGTAEEVVGTFLAKKTIPRNKLFISTKLLPNILDECAEAPSGLYRCLLTSQCTVCIPGGYSGGAFCHAEGGPRTQSRGICV